MISKNKASNLANKSNKKTLPKLQSPFSKSSKFADLTQSSQNMSPQDDEATKPKRKPRQQHWQTSSMSIASINKRSNSALSRTKSPSPNRFNEQQNHPLSSMLKISNLSENINLAKSNSLFLNYSRLIEIETNLTRDYELANTVDDYQTSQKQTTELERPKTAAGIYLSSYNSNSNEHNKLQTVKIDLPLPDNQSTEENEYKNIIKSIILKAESNLHNMKETRSKNEIEWPEAINLENSSNCDWLALPDEIWLKVLENLSDDTLGKFGQTCKTFNRLYLDNTLCKYL